MSYWNKSASDNVSEIEASKFTPNTMLRILNAYSKYANITLGKRKIEPVLADEDIVLITNELLMLYLESKYTTKTPTGIAEFVLKSEPIAIKSVFMTFKNELTTAEFQAAFIDAIDKHVEALNDTANILITMKNKLTTNN